MIRILSLPGVSFEDRQDTGESKLIRRIVHLFFGSPRNAADRRLTTLDGNADRNRWRVPFQSIVIAKTKARVKWQNSIDSFLKVPQFAQASNVIPPPSNFILERKQTSTMAAPIRNIFLHHTDRLNNYLQTEDNGTTFGIRILCPTAACYRKFFEVDDWDATRRTGWRSSPASICRC